MTKNTVMAKFVSFMFFAWMLTALWGGAYYLSPHYASYKVDDLRNIASSEDPELRAHHFLSLQCACSKKLLKHLLTRKADPQLHETIHLVGEDLAIQASLTEAGYTLDTISSEQLAMEKYNLKVLPQLLVKQGTQIAYQGGYAVDQKHTEAYQDQLIFKELRDRHAVAPFPIRGCMNGFFKNQIFADLGGWL